MHNTNTTSIPQPPDEKHDEALHHDGYRNLPSLARDHVRDWDPKPQSLYRAELYRLQSLAHSANSQRRTNEERPTTRGKDSDYRELRDHRPLCNRPKGLKMKAGDAAEYAVVRCQLCEGCKLWARMLDQERVGESIKRPVWFEVSEDRYQSIRHKIKDAPYFTAPLKEDRRAVIVESGFRPTDENGEPIPVEPIENMEALLSRFDHNRDRTQGRSGRRVSTGGMRSRKALEREIYQEKSPETKPEPEAIREVVGTFSPPRQLTEMGDLSKAGEWLGKLCDSIGVEWERSPIGIVVHDTDPLDKALKVRKGRALWRTDDPPPEFYDQRALFLEPPPEFPAEYQEWRQRVKEAAA